MKKFSNLFKFSLVTTLTIAFYIGSPSVSKVFAQDDTNTQPIAQETPENKPSTKQKLSDELKAKALKLLDGAISESSTLRLPSNRIRMQLLGAETFWKYDQQRSLGLITEVMSALNEVARLEAENKDEDYEQTQLRQEIISRISTLDPKLAYQIILAMKQTFPQTPDSDAAKQLDEMELSVASQMAIEDSKNAVKIAEESLKKGFSANLLPVLSQVNSKDSAAATKLATDIIKKLQTADSLDDQIFSFMMGLFSQTKARSSNKKSSSDEQQDSQFIIIDEQSRRDLINILLKKTLSNKNSSTSPYFIRAIANLIDESPTEFDRYARSQANAIKAKVAEFDKVFGKEEEFNSKFFEGMYSLSVDEMLAKAEQAPANMKDYAYYAAISQIIAQGDIERAKQLINQKVTDPTQRTAFMSQIDSLVMNKAASQGKVDEVNQIVSKIRSKDERISTLVGIAVSSAQSKDFPTALTLANQVQTLIGQKASNPTQLDALIQVAQIYAEVAPQKSFSLYSSIVDQINTILSATISLEGFNPYGDVIKEGELSLGDSGTFPYIDQCINGLSELAKADFDLAESVSKRFYLPELVIKAKIQMANQLLNVSESANEEPKNPNNVE